MTSFARWCRFNLVGLAGMPLQLGALALFNRWSGGRYLLASAAALELTLLHNFLWHIHFTWKDRSTAGSWPAQLLRFHLSNGLVSWAGNIGLTWLLVRHAHLPILPANFIAILCCSVANFSLSHAWVFSQAAHPRAAS